MKLNRQKLSSRQDEFFDAAKCAKVRQEGKRNAHRQSAFNRQHLIVNI